jgi:molybdopterin-guanine dinucleotide biosynthesis protein A
MTDTRAEITGILLVGGRSRRLGRDKAFVELSGRPLFERALDLLRGRFARVLLVGDRPERFAAYGLPFLPDIYPGSALGGLYTGLLQAGTEHVFVSACDLPYPSGAVADHLCGLRHGVDAVVPLCRSTFETLFAVYGRGCLGPMKRLLELGNLRVYDVYPQVKVRYVEGGELERLGEEGRSFFNINTPREYETVRKEFPR